MSVLMFINIKGGVAKTTNAVAVSQFLAEAGHRVLVIDADHQCAAGELLLGASRLERSDSRGSTLHDLLSELVKDEFDVDTFANYVVPIASGHDSTNANTLSVLPSSLRIDEYQRNYNDARLGFHSNDEFHAILARRLGAFRRWLRANYDYTIIDCPPSLALQVQMLVKVADAYIVPSVPDKLSVRGTHYLVDRLRRKNFKILGLGTLWSLYKEQNSIHRDMVELSRRRKELFAGIPTAFDTIIPNATAIVRAMESVNGSGNSNGSLNAKYTYEFAKLYRELVGEIIDRCRRVPGARKQQQKLCAES
jgi:chromosome partitioning protein